MPTVLKLVRTKEGSPRDSIRLAGKTAHKITSINTPVPNVAAKSKPEGLLAQPVAHAVSLGQQITLQTPSQPSIPPTTGVLVNPNPLFGAPQPCLIVPQAIAPQQSVLIQNVKPMIQPALPYVSADRYEVNPYLGNYTEKREKKNAKSTMQTDTVEYFDCYRTYVDMPGLTERDIKIEIDGNTIVITGKRKLNYPHNIGILYNERFSGPFRIVIPFVPEKVDSTHINAYMENGVLVVTLKKLHYQH